jgi:hypothetical protein
MEMQRTSNRLPAFMVAAGLLTPLAGVSVRAQQAPAGRVPTRPAAEVFAQIGQSAGVVILADSTVQGRLPMPASPATAQTVEQQITQMVRALPAGATWVKLYVPTPANGRWSADLVADYARIQARLVGTTGRPAPEGMVEILGRYVPANKVGEYTTALNLKLVYLITSTQSQGGPETPANWAQMSPELRQEYANQQAQRIMALTPPARMQLLRHMLAQHLVTQRSGEVTPQQLIIRAVWGQMPDEEQVAVKSSVASDTEAGGGK